MVAKIFIDGEAGTTGLEIRGRLEKRQDVELIRLADDARKDASARAGALAAADVAILCLPDAAARQAADMAAASGTRLIDASTAHRTDPGWVYGFAEMTAGQREKIAGAARVSNPGCYACSAVALIRPLVEAGILPAGCRLTINAVSGYSGGGRKMVEEYEKSGSPGHDAFMVYGLTLDHKHVPEIKVHGLLENRPLLVPSVGNFRQGMIVQVPLQLSTLPGAPTAADIHAALAGHYAGQKFVTVADIADITGISAESLNGTNEIHIRVMANEAAGHAVLAALSDNLGKGAAGQAVQNLNLMLGVEESTGLHIIIDRVGRIPISG
ncbi:MAG TPA: N-acetyl-gamma-glutamyl-phosphate reductase [Alphaproteobacteria bacterium]|nr:N-acetyl-gamma-glutamyl-phosphate reductase [Alphaproteobacteria bacterium]